MNPGHEEIYWPNGQLKLKRYFIGQPLGTARLREALQFGNFRLFHHKSLPHREDGPAILLYNKAGKIIKQQYWINGWRVYIGTYLMMIRKAEDKNKKFVEIIEKFKDPAKMRRHTILLANLSGISEKLKNSVLGALELVF